MITTETDSGVLAVRVRVTGRLDGDGARAIRPTLENLAADPHRDVVLDFTEVTFLDGAGIGAVAFLFKRLMAHGCRLAVVGRSAQPRALIGELGLGRSLDFSDGLGQARRRRRPALAWRAASVFKRSRPA